MHWVQESEEAKHVDYVLYIDADMLLRLPMDPVKMGVKPGVVVSEHVGYLDTGLQNGLQYQFLPKEQADISARTSTTTGRRAATASGMPPADGTTSSTWTTSARLRIGGYIIARRCD